MSTHSFKWGLIGYGDLAEKRVAAALKNAPGSQLCSVWGRNFDKASDFAKRHQIPKSYSSLDELLRSDIDGIYVCTPTDSHAEYGLAALQHGKHVLLEKPMASSVRECEEMIRFARSKKLWIGVAYYRRAFPKMRKIKELIDSGALGTPVWVNMSAHSWFNPPMNDPKYWRVEKTRSGGGGALTDIGVHRLDLLNYWLGPSKVRFKTLHQMVHSYEVEDGSSIVLELKNGAPVHAYFSWNSKTWMDRFEIVGSESKIIVEPLDGASLVLIRGREREEFQIEPPSNAHLPCVEDFVKAVSEKREPLCNGEDGLHVNRLLQEILN